GGGWGGGGAARGGGRGEGGGPGRPGRGPRPAAGEHAAAQPASRRRSSSHNTLHGASSLRASVARTPGWVANITRPATRTGRGAGAAPRLAMRCIGRSLVAQSTVSPAPPG